MKRIILLSLAMLAAASPAWAAGDVIPITGSGITIGTTAVAAGHSYSPVSTFVYDSQGYFALQGTITGDGTAKIEYWTSLDGTTYREPTGATDIISGFTKTSGPASDGRFYIQFQPDFCKYIKIVITETGGLNTITPAVYLLRK